MKKNFPVIPRWVIIKRFFSISKIKNLDFRFICLIFFPINFEVFSLLGDGKSKIKTISNKNLNKKPKFAILPFANTSKDEDSGFLVDGIVEDLITEFSMMREFEILSRQTTVNFKDENQDIKAFSKKFDLDFIVTGGIRASGKRVRISIELSDAKDDSIIWSNKYDRVLEDIFDLQDEIVRKISIALLGEIEISSLQRSKESLLRI